MIKIADKHTRQLRVNGVNVKQVMLQGIPIWVDTPVQQAFENDFTLIIPPYAAFIDVIALGGGASGQNGEGAVGIDGKGGNAGQWSVRTYARQSYPQGLASINVVVGAGGERPADKSQADPRQGGNSGAYFFNNAGVLIQELTVSAPGGVGKASGRNGGDPGNYSLNGTTYYGGLGGRTSENTSAVAPGGGGYGGGGGVFGSFARGYIGAPGKVWVVFRSF